MKISLEAALDLYREFHSLEPANVRRFDRRFEIPDKVCLAGDAVHVLYRSGKVDPATGQRPRSPVDYIHSHDPGVKLYLTEDTGARPRRVPKWIRDADALVLLGDCLGFAFADRSGRTTEAEGVDPLPDLYAHPSGKALYVIQSRRELIALIWGGRLNVEYRGIVH